MSILIVDDDCAIRRILAIRLQSEGYDVVSVATAAEAFNRLGLENGPEKPPAFDLILMDIFLPSISGIEACRQIKAKKHTRDIPIIMVTANSDMKFLEDAFEAGAADFLSKPFNRIELLARIRSALRLKREIDRRRSRERELTEIAERFREANIKLERLSALDGLTNVYNRRYFDEILQKEFQRAMRTHAPLSLIMMDIDEFKLYNDILGHQAGDECLRRIANVFSREITRSHDLVARYGGEEFAAILPETDNAGASALAERLRGCVMELDIRHPASPVAPVVTISLGVATLIPVRGSNPRELVALADRALYQSKSRSRNRITSSGTVEGTHSRA